MRLNPGSLQPADSRPLSTFSGPPPTQEPRRDEDQRPELPAENVAYLGRSLFTDYLLPVELGARCCWSRRSAPSRSPAVARRNPYEPAAAQLPGGRGRAVRPGDDRLFGPAQPDHHVPVGGDDAARVAVNLVAFARFRGNLQGQAFTLFILTVAACEAGIALALFLTLYRSKKSLDVSAWQDLREPGQPPTLDEEPLPAPLPEEPLPKLTPTGHEPQHREAQTHV